MLGHCPSMLLHGLRQVRFLQRRLALPWAFRIEVAAILQEHFAYGLVAEGPARRNVQRRNRTG
eukprot:9420767-Lingulodinium_polyedra.AAC.1